MSMQGNKSLAVQKASYFGSCTHKLEHPDVVIGTPAKEVFHAGLARWIPKLPANLGFKAT